MFISFSKSKSFFVKPEINLRYGDCTENEFKRIDKKRKRINSDKEIVRKMFVEDGITNKYEILPTIESKYIRNWMMEFIPEYWEKRNCQQKIEEYIKTNVIISLWKREIKLLELHVKGKSNNEIAKEMGIPYCKAQARCRKFEKWSENNT